MSTYLRHHARRSKARFRAVQVQVAAPPARREAALDLTRWLTHLAGHADAA